MDGTISSDLLKARKDAVTPVPRTTGATNFFAKDLNIFDWWERKSLIGGIHTANERCSRGGWLNDGEDFGLNLVKNFMCWKNSM